MSKTLTMTGCLAMAAAVAWTSHLAAQSQPVRDGIRRTGEIAAEGTRAAVRGTRNAIDRSVDATRNAVDNTTEAARARIDRNQRNEIETNAGISVDGRNDINATTRVGGNQIQGDANLNPNRNQVQVDSRFDSQSLDSVDRYESGYRGVDEGSLPPAAGQAQPSGHVEYNGRAYALRHDSQGHEFICVCGRPVYFDNAGQGQQSRDAYKMSGDSIQEDRMYQGRSQQQSMREDQNQDRSDYRPQGGYSAVPAPPEPIRTDAADVSPAGPTLNTEAESSADLSGDTDLDTEADADIDASNSSSTEADQADREVNELEEEAEQSTDSLPTN
jgi:hypothetical protein